MQLCIHLNGRLLQLRLQPRLGRGERGDLFGAASPSLQLGRRWPSSVLRMTAFFSPGFAVPDVVLLAKLRFSRRGLPTGDNDNREQKFQIPVCDMSIPIARRSEDKLNNFSHSLLSAELFAQFFPWITQVNRVLQNVCGIPQRNMKRTKH